MQPYKQYDETINSIPRKTAASHSLLCMSHLP